MPTPITHLCFALYAICRMMKFTEEIILYLNKHQFITVSVSVLARFTRFVFGPVCIYTIRTTCWVMHNEFRAGKNLGFWIFLGF